MSKVTPQMRATVNAYITNLRAPKPKGRRRTVDSVTAQLETVDKRLVEAQGTELVVLTQEKLNLRRELTRVLASEEPGLVEDAFVTVVLPFSEALDITYEAWREVGVPAAVLRRGGLHR